MGAESWPTLEEARQKVAVEAAAKPVAGNAGGGDPARARVRVTVSADVGATGGGDPARARVRVTVSADVGATGSAAAGAVGDGGFPSFPRRAVERIRDGAAIHLAKRIERVRVPVIPPQGTG